MLLVFLVAAITKVEEDVDGGPPGVLSIFLVAATIKVEEDVNGGPPGECCQYFWQ
jgi:hypothetical protein